MALTLETAPSGLPVTLDTLKSHLRVTSVREDDLLELYLAGATGRFDGPRGILNRCLLEQIWKWTLDCFPPGDLGLPVPLDPLVSVESVQYRDSTGALQTMPSTDYTVDTKSEPGWIAPALGKSWPVVAQQVYNAVTITLKLGYPEAGAVPAGIRLAILGLASQLYEQRSPFDGPAELPKWVHALVVDYKIPRP